MYCSALLSVLLQDLRRVVHLVVLLVVQLFDLLVLPQIVDLVQCMVRHQNLKILQDIQVEQAKQLEQVLQVEKAQHIDQAKHYLFTSVCFVRHELHILY